MPLRKLLCLLTASLTLVSWLPVGAQVVINEACSYNGDLIEDENGDEPDWIELYNSGSNPVDLFNYSLIDNSSDRWYFPHITLQPSEFLVVFASGENRFTIPLHTNFKIDKEGETLRLYDATGALADEIVVPEMHLDHSFGLKPDGSVSGEGLFGIPTPGTSNLAAIQYSGYATDPVFSLAAGFYNGSRTLEISGGGPSQVYYTTDGNIPTPSSMPYMGPITIDSTTVVRACSFSALSIELPSRVVTSTYILNYPQTLPVWSLSTDPDNLWDWDTGIYVMGPNASPNYPYFGANFWQDWEIKCNMEFFENSGERIFSQDVGVSIHGGTSNRSKPMKSLRLTNRSKYGEDGFHYKFFDNKPLDDFKVLVLRNSSGDFNKTHFRDGSLHNLMIGTIDVDLNAYRPSAVFLNGEYFGVHNIRERVNKFYIEDNNGVDGDNIDLLEEDSLVLEGDFTAFNAMHDYVTTNDMSVPANFESAARMIETESLCDYYIAETFLSNIDWPYNNIKFWRERKPDARWRYILIDLDIALGTNGWAPASFDILGRIMGPYGDNNRHVQIFKSMLQNKPFKEYFINRYADLVNTLFTSDHMWQHIEKVRSALVAEMPMHFAKWGNDMQGWDHEVYEVVMPHVYNRPGYAMEQVRDVFALDGIVNLELNVWPPGAGTIGINTITPGPLPWKGNYFNGNPVNITVFPNPGYTFVRWDSNVIPLTDAGSPLIRVNPTFDNNFTAYFSTSDDPSQLMVYPNPTSGLFYFGCLLDHPGRGKIEIINATGQTVLTRNDVPLADGVNRLQYDASALNSGVYVLHLITDEGTTKHARLVIE